MDAGPEEGLGGVDVAHPDDDPGVHEEALDRPPPALLRRLKARISRPVVRFASSRGSTGTRRRGSRTSESSIVSPTRWGRRLRRRTSTSGSSGMGGFYLAA